MSLKIHLALKVILIAFCLISILSFLIPSPEEDYKKSHGYSWEEYEPSYFLKFQSVNDIIKESDKHFNPAEINTVAYYNYIAEIIRKRFYHDYCFYSFTDNPFAFLAGKLTQGNLSAVVLPDDIMKHPMAACSQQAIVMMEIFRRKGVNYRKMGFDHHYTVEGMIEGGWRYFDTDMEPDFKDKRESYDKILSSHMLDSVYSNVKMSKTELYAALGNPRYGKINAAPAPRASSFHKLCFFLNSIYFLIFAFVVMLLSEISNFMKEFYKRTMIAIYSPIRV
jgi:hypothetical protein